MARVNFNLKSDKNSKSKLIVMIVNFGYYELDERGEKKYKFLKYSTGKSIPDKDFWEKSKQRVKETSRFPDYENINNHLNDLQKEVHDIIREFERKQEFITPDLIREKLNLSSSDCGKDRIGLISFIKDHIEKVKSTRKPSTIIVYNTTRKHLEEYSKKKNKYLTFYNITLDFYQDFVDYLLTEKKLTKNTIGKYIKTIKTFMNEATERKLNKNFDFKSGRFKTFTEESESIYLNPSELQKIWMKDFSDNKKLEKVRDLFLIGCWTGLRFSDLKQLRPENISKTENGGLISIRTEKTGEKVVIPLHPLVKEILNKYEGKIPKAISNQKLNLYIKDVVEAAEINEKVVIKKYKGNLSNDKAIEKHKLVTSHTARRSFATNMYLNDVPAISIMKVTGHKTESSFLKYIKISQEDNARKLLTHPVFNSNLSVIQ